MIKSENILFHKEFKMIIEDDLDEKDYSFGDELNEELNCDFEDAVYDAESDKESLNDFEYDDIYGDKFDDPEEDSTYTDDIPEDSDTEFEEFGA